MTPPKTMINKPTAANNSPSQVLGYTFQPVNDETIRLLNLAGSHLVGVGSDY